MTTPTHADPARHPITGAVTDALMAWVRTPAALLLIRAALDQLTGTAPLHTVIDATTMTEVAAAADLGAIELTGT